MRRERESLLPDLRAEDVDVDVGAALPAELPEDACGVGESRKLSGVPWAGWAFAA